MENLPEGTQKKEGCHGKGQLDEFLREIIEKQK